MLALVDCNNFFVACERLFRPDLWYKPVVVLSNNDGCIIARSNEAKALGIPMGAPYFKYRQFCHYHNVTVFSSNFTLYRDLSARVINVLNDHVTQLQWYSVDEAFLELSPQPGQSYNDLGKELRNKIAHYLGLPVSIGIAPTKVLAKLMSERAKQGAGVVDWLTLEDPELALAQCPIDKIWGIGQRMALRLRQHGIDNALDLRDCVYSALGHNADINIRRLIDELKGRKAYPLQNDDKPHRSMRSTRSLGQATRCYEHLQRAISFHVVQTVHKLHQEKQRAGHMTVFISSRHSKCRRVSSCELDTPSSDPVKLLKIAKQLLSQCYQPQHFYHKTGVLLDKLETTQDKQLSLFDTQDDQDKPRVQAWQAVNNRFGGNTLRFAVQGFNDSAWHARKDYSSPRYTTHWNELPLVRLS